MASAAAFPAEVLRKYRTIAVVGASRDPSKAANSVPKYLKDHGYRIIPVNPTANEIVGEKSYPSLSDLQEEVAQSVDIVEVFRPSQELPRVAREVVEMKKRYGRPFVFWAQLGLESEEAKKTLAKNDVGWVMNACMRTVHQLQLRATS